MLLAVAISLVAARSAAPIVNLATFDGARAYGDLQALVALGPRPSRSAGADAARALIRERLRQAGWKPESELAGDGVESITSHLPGTRDDRIVIATHFDTKRLPHGASPGANDGASGTALLLELARVLAGEKRESEIWLLLFDGHEPRGHEITAGDGLEGSASLARKWQDDGSLDRVRAFLVVDQVADKSLELSPAGESWPPLVQDLLPIARQTGVSVSTEKLYRFPNDHTPFRERGVRPIVTVIDYELGGAPAPGPIWHSAQDDLSATSAESLGRVGELVIRLVRAIDAGGDSASARALPTPPRP